MLTSVLVAGKDTTRCDDVHWIGEAGSSLIVARMVYACFSSTLPGKAHVDFEIELDVFSMSNCSHASERCIVSRSSDTRLSACMSAFCLLPCSICTSSLCTSSNHLSLSFSLSSFEHCISIIAPFAHYHTNSSLESTKAMASVQPTDMPKSQTPQLQFVLRPKTHTNDNNNPTSLTTQITPAKEATEKMC